MLESSKQRIVELLSDADQVLDVGAGLSPFERADWVIDLLPHSARGEYAYERSDAERFTEQTWVQRDICDREPWPFADDQFDFVICSHTLEDVRDPVWICSELNRVARAGYVEVPSRLEEQSWGVRGPWVGWSHHHWLCDVHDDEIEFVFKPHVIHGRPSDYFPADFPATLTDEQKVQQLWWRGGFHYRERIFAEAAELDQYLRRIVDENPVTRPHPRARGRRWLARLIAR
jgi:hypothetical protein